MNYKNAAALMTAAALSFSLVGCRKGGNSSQKGGLDISFEHSFSAEQVKVDGMTSMYSTYKLGNNLLIGGADEQYQSVYALYNPSDRTVKSVSLKYIEDTTKENTFANVVSVIVDEASSSVMILYNAYSYDKDMYKDLGYTVETYDMDMNLKDTKEAGTLIGENNYLNRIEADGNGTIYAVVGDNATGNTTLKTYDMSFKETGTIQLDNIQYVNYMMQTKDGGMALVCYDMDYNEQYMKINPETKKAEKIELEGLPRYSNGTFAGSGDYDFYLYDTDSAYGVDLSKGTVTEVINWLNSDFMGDYVSTAAALPDGKFALFSYDSNYDKCEMWMLEERDPKELENVNLISLSTLYANQSLLSAVNDYNRAHKDTRIIVERYDKYSTDEDYEAGLTKFKNDMTSGIVADIICMDSLPFESLANKGLFTDIYTLMENDSSFNKADYFENFFRSLEYGEKLYRIGTSFSVNTLAAKEEFVGTESGQNFAAFVDKVKNLPNGMTAFMEMTRYSAQWELIQNNLDCFVDKKNATCDFNNQTFIDLLEYCKTFPESTDYDTMEDADWDKYWDEQDKAYRDNKVLFYSAYISSLQDYHIMLKGTFGDAPVTMIGYPTEDDASNGGRFQTNYTLAVSANSKNQTEAWEFIKFLLSEEEQLRTNWSFPVSRAAFDTLMQEQQKPNTYIDENGNEVVSEEWLWGNGSLSVDIGYPKQQEADALKAYIEGITINSYYDSDIYDILSEEMEMFYSGDQSAADAAKMIQSRVGLYLSESH